MRIRSACAALFTCWLVFTGAHRARTHPTPPHPTRQLAVSRPPQHPPRITIIMHHHPSSAASVCSSQPVQEAPALYTAHTVLRWRGAACVRAPRHHLAIRFLGCSYYASLGHDRQSALLAPLRVDGVQEVPPLLHRREGHHNLSVPAQSKKAALMHEVWVSRRMHAACVRLRAAERTMWACLPPAPSPARPPRPAGARR